NVHGNPLGEENWNATKGVYGWEHEAFTVPAEAAELFSEKVTQRGQAAHAEWEKAFNAYAAAEPEKAKALELAFSGQLPADYDELLTFADVDTKADATRNSSSKAIQAIAEKVPFFWGGSADLSGSNKTMNNSSIDFMPESRDGRNIWFGVREFAMAA